MNEGTIIVSWLRIAGSILIACGFLTFSLLGERKWPCLEKPSDENSPLVADDDEIDGAIM